MSTLWTPENKELARKLNAALTEHVDKLQEEDRFWVRDVEYQVVSLIKEGILIRPIGYGKRTAKLVRRKVRDLS